MDRGAWQAIVHGAAELDMSEQLSRLPKKRAIVGFSGGSGSKESTCNAGDPGLIPGFGRSPGEGNDYTLQYSSCRILWTEEPGSLQSMGPQRVRHD